ncbi:MAG: hypothetical protein IT447_16235 [Phycisphaerales bacterium]|jgi:hypothetical protein|nr:hypothetical protein [Phycisphaerales bacterium]
MRKLWRIALGVMIGLGWMASPVVWADQTPTTAPAQAEAVQSPFLRFVDEGAAGGMLESGEVTLVNAEGVSVDLIAAIHIGETSYYQELNRHFQDFDAVLYEMVMPKGMRPLAPGAGGDSSVAQLQRFLKDVLGLDYQLDVIDYRPANFIHADMDTETFEQLQRQRGESFASLMLQGLMRALADPPPQVDAQAEDLLDLLTRPDLDRQIKLVLARQLGDIERMAGGLDGPDGSVILTERNKAAMKVFEETLKQGHRHIAIFYGAAHMPDLQKRVEAMGFKPVNTQWRLAWDLHIRADQPSGVERLLDKAMQTLDEE